MEETENVHNAQEQRGMMSACLRRIVAQGVFCSIVALIGAFATAPAAADTHYVSLGGHVVSPYANWYDAATNIQLALAVVGNDDVILVSNGVYHLATTITWDTTWTYRSVTITSLYGSAVTIIDGAGMVPNGAWPYGLYLNSPTTICGFTFTNFTPVAIAFRDGNGTNQAIHTFYDCVVDGNLSTGIRTMSGTHSAILSNCVVRGNAAGGIVTIPTYLQIDNSVISSNRGGGVIAAPVLGVVIRNSTVSGNTNTTDGGGINCNWGAISNCVIVNNSSSGSGGGLYGGMTADNCLMANNLSKANGGGVYNSGLLRNCIVANNTVSNSGGGVFNFGAARVYNCMIVSNYARLAACRT